MIDISIEKKSLTEKIYDVLRYQITHREIKQGEKIDINTLKERFKVSQTPIREALLKLERDGLVVFKANVCVEVVKLDTKFINEVCTMLSILDSSAIELAMNSGKLKELQEELEYHVLEHEHCVQLDDKYWYHANQVHMVFYKYADNNLLNKHESIIHALSDMIFGEYAKEQENRVLGINDHKRILAAVRENNVQEAVNVIRMHWLNAPKAIMNFCDK